MLLDSVIRRRLLSSLSPWLRELPELELSVVIVQSRAIAKNLQFDAAALNALLGGSSNFSFEELTVFVSGIGGQESMFEHKAAHFFKIILHDTILSEKLVIPKKFARKYGAELFKSDTVLLKVPGGDVWQMELRRGDGSIWLENGWMDFMKFYAIKHGHFLVFQYKLECSDELNVVVFDKSATEIEYPTKSLVASSPVNVEYIDEDDIIPTETKTSGANHSPRMTRDRSSHSRINRSRGRLRGEEKVKALERAKSFKSSNPYFPTVMQPYHIHPSYRLNVPGRFLLTYIGTKKNGEMKLFVSGDKIWTVGYNMSIQGKQVTTKVERGWKAFVLDNRLGYGDVCVFELVKTLRSILFKISIFRAPQVTESPSTSQFQDSGGGPALSMLEDSSGTKSQDKEKNASFDVEQECISQRIAGGFKPQPACLLVSKHPFFQVAVTKSCVSYGILTIPFEFTRKHLHMNRREQIATLQVGDRSWLAKAIMQSSSKIVFSGGFPAFVKGNSLKERDLCTFELIQMEQILFRVSIHRADGE